MPRWGNILQLIFTGIFALIAVIGLIRSFDFATKEDIEKLERELKTEIRNINRRIDRHLETHASQSK